MKRGAFTKHGSSRTTFSGTVDREDVQPNEGLVRKRTSGPPALKPAAPPPVRSVRGRWGQSGNKGRPWSKPGSQWNHSSSRTTTDSNSAGPSNDRYSNANSSGNMASEWPNNTPAIIAKRLARPHADQARSSQFPPRHNKRLKTSHDSSETARRDPPPHHLQNNAWQHGRPPNVPPLPHRKPIYSQHVPPQTQPLPTPSTSASPCLAYAHAQPNPQGKLPVPPLPSRATKLALLTSPTLVPLSNATPTLHPVPFEPSSPYQIVPPPPKTPSPYQVSLPTSELPNLRQLGIVPVARGSLPPPHQPQPAAVLLHERDDGKWMTLMIDMSLVHPSHLAGLANLLHRVSVPLQQKVISMPKPPPLLRPPQPQICPTTRWGAPGTRFAHIPVSPTTKPIVSPYTLPSPTPELPPASPQSMTIPRSGNERYRSPPPMDSLEPPASVKTRRHEETPQPQIAPPIPPKIKTEPPPTPGLFTTTPLAPSSAYVKPGEMVPQTRRLVQNACTRYILPLDCHTEYNPDGFKAARMAFFKKKRQELKAKGLNVQKKVVLRDDGIVFEWTSPVPIWTDTFLPEGRRETMDLAAAINGTSLGNARVTARGLKRARSNPRSRSISASRRSPAPETIVLDHTPPPNPPTAAPQPAPESESLGAVAPELGPSIRIIRPSQVIPPNPHPPKRIFRPVHVPRAAASESVKEKEPNDNGQSGRACQDVEITTTTTQARTTPLTILPEPAQPTPLRSPAPAPVTVTETNPAIDEYGGLEYIDEPANQSSAQEEDLGYVEESGYQDSARDDVLEYPDEPIHETTPHARVEDSDPQLGLGKATEPSPSPSSGSGSSVERVMEDLTERSRYKSPEATPPVHLTVVKTEEHEVIDLVIPGSTDGSVQPSVERIVKKEAEVDYEDDGSEGSQVEGDDILELARQFLLRYIDTFDYDRTQLEEAYSPDATFSISIHDDTGGKETSMASMFCTEERPPQRRASSANTTLSKTASQPKRIYRGRDDIIRRLNSLGPHKFLSPRLPHAHPSPVYDIVAHPVPCPPHLNDGDPVDQVEELVLASLHSEAVNTTRLGRSVVQDHIVAVDQNFVLKLRNEGLMKIEEVDGEGRWPLVAVSHQMIVRDGPMLRQEEVEDVLPWAAEIRAASEGQ